MFVLGCRFTQLSFPLLPQYSQLVWPSFPILTWTNTCCYSGIRFIATCHYHLFLTLIPPFFRHMQRPSRSNMINHYSSADNHATAGSTHTYQHNKAEQTSFQRMKKKSLSPSSLSLSLIQTPSAHPLVLNFSLAHPIPPNTTLLLFFFPCLLLLIPVTFFPSLSLSL
ncbi:hypothetical protein GGI42DRAFT_224641 [Trichoderma sp. SZMC 28013]